MRAGRQRCLIRRGELDEHAAHAPKPAEEHELLVARRPHERMITVQKCNMRRRLAVHELCCAARRDVKSGRIGCSVRAPFGYLACVGVPIDVRTGEEIGTRVSLIHEIEGMPCAAADSISRCTIRAHRKANAPLLARAIVIARDTTSDAGGAVI